MAVSIHTPNTGTISITSGLSEETRTPDPLPPKQPRYRCATLRSDIGANGRNRTRNRRVTKALLYRLSYTGKFWRPCQESNLVEQICSLPPNQSATWSWLLPVFPGRQASAHPLRHCLRRMVYTSPVVDSNHVLHRTSANEAESNRSDLTTATNPGNHSLVILSHTTP